MRKSIKKEAERRYRAKELPEITAHYFGLLDKDFNNGFVRIMTENYEVVKGSMEGVSALLKMYMEYIFDFKRLENNHHLDFGAFYENNEHDYRIAK